uniref:Molybdopterin biosynthesis protein n=1 Tax=Thuretia quercifolia TaxID=189650 RepID=A0A1Z1ML34_9FLOR|nr:Molybdopterin biosynthesis protein [Thuretia quercifolia]ARW66505.1 Molybdopterin biosynthesis protein [Thuretia quercifolia]
MLNPNINKIELLTEEYILYAKHLTIKNVGLNGQKRLKKSKVLIIGAGGLGCPILLYLVTSGLGYIGIVDNDLIEKSNLNRQILYKANNLKKLKVECAKENLKEINPNCKIITHSYKLNKINALEIIQYYDIIIDATDSFKTRYTIDDTCHKLHKIHIYGAVQQFDNQISVFNYKNSTRYSIMYPKNLQLQDNSCNNNGILGINTGYTGILQSIEVIKIILGIGNIIYNKLHINNILNKSTLVKKIKIRYSYSLKKENKNKKYLYNLISISELKFLELQSKNRIIIIDIREIYEVSKNKIKYSINIPLKSFKDKKTLKFIQKKSYNKQIIIYCSKIYRSLVASNILKSQKMNHYILN